MGMSRFRKHLRPEYRWRTKELNRVSDHLRRAAAETDILDSATDVGREDRAQVRWGGRWVTLRSVGLRSPLDRFCQLAKSICSTPTSGASPSVWPVTPAASS